MTQTRTAAGPGTGRSPSPLTVVGVLLIVAGLACLGWVGYQFVGTNVVSERAYRTERDDLKRAWAGPAPAGETGAAPTALPGGALALLRIPALGRDFEVLVLEGTSLDVLARGVGHYTATAGPGQVGNFAVAGHRITHGEPFRKLLELEVGDRIVVETRESVFTYAVDTAPRSLTVTDTDTWVIDPVPGHPESRPTRALITLTTCQDLFHSPDRSVAFGHLVSTTGK